MPPFRVPSAHSAPLNSSLGSLNPLSQGYNIDLIDSEIRRLNMAKGPDFSKETIDILAKRAGQVCSNPKCDNTTSGPHSDEAKAVNLGEAAHIKGARLGSKRYNPSMTNEERSHISNGIWLCRLCAREIDTDERRFPVNLLNSWKEGS